jgi:tyrosinase
LDGPDGGGAFLKSPIFDPVSGFGGNGKKIARAGESPYPITGSGGGCLTDGPFANHSLHIGPYGEMVASNARCLRRDFSPRHVEVSASKEVLSRVLKANTYARFSASLSNDLHAVGHGSVGGEVCCCNRTRIVL